MVLADEPTGNLDSKTGMAIMEVMRRSCDELGQTVVIVTHDSRAAAYSDRVVFLADGLISTEVKCKDADMSQRLRIVLETMERLAT
jgi:putative ABC transport system ATP-binding protein